MGGWGRGWRANEENLWKQLFELGLAERFTIDGKMPQVLPQEKKKKKKGEGLEAGMDWLIDSGILVISSQYP